MYLRMSIILNSNGITLTKDYIRAIISQTYTTLYDFVVSKFMYFRLVCHKCVVYEVVESKKRYTRRNSNIYCNFLLL